MTELWVLSDSLYSWGVRLHMNSIHQATIVRLKKTTGCGEGNICSISSGRWIWPLWESSESLHHWSGSGWMFRAMWVTGVKSACHTQLNGVLRHPAETPSSEQKCDRNTLDGEQRLRQQRLTKQRGQADAAFHVAISFLQPGNNFINFICAFFFVHLRLSACLSLDICWLFTCISVHYNHSCSSNWDVQNLWHAPWLLCAKIKYASFKFILAKLVGFTVESFFEFRRTFCSCSVTGWTNFFRFVG